MITDTVLLNNWLAAKAALDKAKKQELELRNQILPKVLEDKQSGSKTTIFGGHKVTATARLNYTLDEAEYSILTSSLGDDELACIQWRPKVNIKAYSMLPDDSLLRTAVTVKPGQAGLAIKE